MIDRRVRLAVAVLGMALGSCGRESSSPVETETSDPRIAIASGDGQRGPVGTSLPDFLVVQVTEGGRPANAVLVSWDVIEGDGQLSRKGDRSDRQGLAAAVLFLGHQPGEQVVRAALENGREVQFTARALGSESIPSRSAAPQASGRAVRSIDPPVAPRVESAALPAFD